MHEVPPPTSATGRSRRRSGPLTRTKRELPLLLLLEPVSAGPPVTSEEDEKGPGVILNLLDLEGSLSQDCVAPLREKQVSAPSDTSWGGWTSESPETALRAGL